MNEQKPEVEIPEGMKLVEPQAPDGKQGAEKKEPTLEDGFPIENFQDTVLLIFKATANGQPVQLEVFGNVNTARVAKSGGVHEFQRTNGRLIEVDGHDVLWAECITAREHRDRAIERAKREIAEAAEKAARAAMRPRGFRGWLKGDRKG